MSNESEDDDVPINEMVSRRRSRQEEEQEEEQEETSVDIPVRVDTSRSRSERLSRRLRRQQQQQQVEETSEEVSEETVKSSEEEKEEHRPRLRRSTRSGRTTPVQKPVKSKKHKKKKRDPEKETTSLENTKVEASEASVDNPREEEEAETAKGKRQTKREPGTEETTPENSKFKEEPTKGDKRLDDAKVTTGVEESEVSAENLHEEKAQPEHQSEEQSREGIDSVKDEAVSDALLKQPEAVDIQKGRVDTEEGHDGNQDDGAAIDLGTDTSAHQQVREEEHSPARDEQSPEDVPGAKLPDEEPAQEAKAEPTSQVAAGADHSMITAEIGASTLDPSVEAKDDSFHTAKEEGNVAAMTSANPSGTRDAKTPDSMHVEDTKPQVEVIPGNPSFAVRDPHKDEQRTFLPSSDAITVPEVPMDNVSPAVQALNLLASLSETATAVEIPMKRDDDKLSAAVELTGKKEATTDADIKPTAVAEPVERSSVQSVAPLPFDVAPEPVGQVGNATAAAEDNAEVEENVTTKAGSVELRSNVRVHKSGPSADQEVQRDPAVQKAQRAMDVDVEPSDNLAAGATLGRPDVSRQPVPTGEVVVAKEVTQQHSAASDIVRTDDLMNRLRDKLAPSETKDSVEDTPLEEKLPSVPMEVDSINETPTGRDATLFGAVNTPSRDVEPGTGSGKARDEKKVDSSADRQVRSPVDVEEMMASNEEAHPDTLKVTIAKAPTRTTIRKPTVEDTEALLDAFPLMAKMKKAPEPRKRHKKRRRDQLIIRISGIPESEAPMSKKRETLTIDSKLSDEADPMTSFTDVSFRGLFSEGLSPESEDEDFISRYERELEDSLAFFSETHEEQDPVFVQLQQEKERLSLREELANLKKEQDAGVAEINEIIATQLREKQASADRNIERLLKKLSIDEHRDLRRLHQVYEEKTIANNKKISHGLTLLTQRQSQEVQKAHMQHRQQAQQRGVADQISAAEWNSISQRLQAKQQQQMKDFNAKGEDMKKRFETEYQREKEKYVKHHEKRKREMEHGMQKVITRMRSTFQQQHQRYLKRHVQKMKDRRQEILNRLGESPEKQPAGAVDTGVSYEIAEKPEERSPSPVRLRVSADEPTSGAPGAAARFKHRKGILNVIHKQLSVEIHNEGLWISTLTEKKAEDSKKEGDKSKSDSSPKPGGSDSKNNGEFIPWGVKARSILHSIVVGEIPIGYGTDRFDFGEAVTTQGGHIRCVVIDLRTSEETASAQRAAATKEQEAAALAELEHNADQLSQSVLEAERHSDAAIAEEKKYTSLHEKAVKDVEKAKDLMQQLRNKFKHMLTPDDVPLPTLSASDQKKLSSAVGKYTANVEKAQARLTSAESALYERRTHAQKMATLVRQAQKAATSAASALKKKRAMLADDVKSSRGRQKLSESAETERASTRVADVISALLRAAEIRREELNNKRSSSASSTWVQALPGLSGALKKSLWYKMHRRRQQIVLRPSMDFLVNDMKKSVEETTLASKGRSSLLKYVTSEEAMQRAEALFLLATCPASDSESSPSVPPSNTSESWAEPGWHVNLDVPKDEKGGSRSLLPRVPSFPVMQKHHSEYCSAPGRQVASLIGTTQLQALHTPLSVAAKAISLAETSPLTTEAELDERDPFQTTEAAMMTGYTFSLKPPRSPSRRKPAAAKEEAAAAPKEIPAPSPPPPPKQQALVQQQTEPKKSTSTTSSSRRASKTKSDKPKRSRSKSSTGASPRTKTSRKKMGADAASAASAAAEVASQARTILQQQAAAAALSARAGVYAQQQQLPPQQGQRQPIEQQAVAAAQYSPSFMKQVQSPSQAATLQAALQPPPLQPQQMSAMTPAPAQLLPQPQYPSPQSFQQQQQQRQIAQQMRMMQAAGFQQQQAASMRFFAPPPIARQGSYGKPQMPSRSSSTQQRRSSSSGAVGDDSNNANSDPLFMLPDMQPPP